MATGVQTAINMLQVGALRMPFMFASMNGALLVGEGAYRTVTSTLKFFGFNGESAFIKAISEYTPDLAVRVVRPYRDLTVRQLVIAAIATTIIGALGSDLVALAFGKAPAIYNHVLTFMGNIRISDQLHPATQWAMSRLGF